MKKYNYSDIEKKFKSFLEAIHKGQQTVEFDWLECCAAINSVATLKGLRSSFMDFKYMIDQRDVCIDLNDETIFTEGKDTFDDRKSRAHRRGYPYFLWKNDHIYDSATGESICHKDYV